MRCPTMGINDPGLSRSDKAFEIYVKPLQIQFSVLLAYTRGIHTCLRHFIFCCQQIKSCHKSTKNCSHKILFKHLVNLVLRVIRWSHLSAGIVHFAYKPYDILHYIKRVLLSCQAQSF